MGVYLLDEAVSTTDTIPQQPRPATGRRATVLHAKKLRYEPNPEALPLDEVYADIDIDDPRDPRKRLTYGEYMQECVKSFTSFKSNNHKRRGRRPTPMLKRGDTGKKRRIAVNHLRKVERYELRAELNPDATMVASTSATPNPDEPTVYIDGFVGTAANPLPPFGPAPQRYTLREVFAHLGGGFRVVA